MSDPNSFSQSDENQPSQPEFEELLLRVRSGDSASTAELFAQYQKYLLFLANIEMEPELNAKFGPSDIVQQSLIAANNNIGGFRGTTESEFKGWLRKIVKNHLLNAKRHFAGTKQRQTNREVSLDDSRRSTPGLVDSEKTPQSQALLHEMAVELERCLGQLSESHQMVLRLRNWQEKSFVEIGKELNTNSDAARKLWFRAFEKLRQAILATRPELASQLSSLSANLSRDE